MAVVIDTVAIKDADGNLIVGGTQALDLSGIGTGPWQFMHAIVDGLLAVNRAEVDSGNRLHVQVGGATALSIAKAEDDASANLDVGVPAMYVRSTTPADTSGANGDYEFLKGSGGYLWVRHGVGTEGVAKAEDVASADGDLGIPAMARRTTTPTDTSSANLDYEMLQMAGGRLWVRDYQPLLGDNVKVVTTAGTDVALAASTVCAWVTIQAQTDNTNIIAVGVTGVDATIATGDGIVLYPGDVITIPCDNLATVFIDSLVNGEGVRFIYGY